MTFSKYLKEKWLTYLFIGLAFLFFFAVYLLDLGLNMAPSNVAYVALGWGLFLSVFVVVDYYALKYRVRKMTKFCYLKAPSMAAEEFWYPVDRAYASSVNELVEGFETYKAGIIKMSAEQLEFITKWLHDFKVPISALRLILDNHEENMDRELVKSLEQEVFNIEESAKKVFYEIKSGSLRDDYKIARVSTKTLIANTLKGYARFFSFQKLDIGILGEDYIVVTDEKWSGYILSQIISNAVKHTPIYGKVIISTEKIDNRITISIKNTGKGILPQDIGQIFNKGYTSSENRIASGATGYGLYLAKKLSDILGHMLSVESNYGEDATFSLTFVDYCDGK